MRFLWIIAAALGAVIAARWLLGPFVFLGIPVNAPLNPEGAFGLIVVALLASRPASSTPPSTEPRASASGPALLAAALALAALSPALAVGFLSDDFILVHQARTSTAWLPLFTTPGGDGFFRPLGYLTFNLNALVGGWHLTSLAIHAANAALVAALAVRLGATRLIAFLAGALFALHGTHLEAAVWVAGRFDLLAAFFTLSALLLFGRHTALALACTLAALWSKEAAYPLPALLTLLAWHERKPLKSTIPYWALTAAAFLYRWTLLGGIGGYTAESGESAFFSLKFATTAKAVFVRLWTSLVFPLNWSHDPAFLAALAATAYIAALLWLSWRSRPTSALRLTLASLALSILPPLHLLGGAADLSGGRLLYLPSIWFCLLLALAVAGTQRQPALVAILLAFHFAALHHDLPYWQRASDQVRALCEQTTPNPPRAIEGVPALANGYAECSDPANR